MKNSKDDIEKLVEEATLSFTKILSVNEIKEKYNQLYWGGLFAN